MSCLKNIAQTLVAGIALVAVAACGSAPVSTKVSASPSPTHPVVVTVDTGEFYIKASQTNFKVGVPYHFVLHNSGKIAHEIMVMPVLSPDKAKTVNMDKLALGMVEEENFGAGANGSFDITFDKPYPKGTLEFACHIAGHYEGGMHTAIVVGG